MHHGICFDRPSMSHNSLWPAELQSVSYLSSSNDFTARVTMSQRGLALKSKGGGV